MKKTFLWVIVSLVVLVAGFAYKADPKQMAKDAAKTAVKEVVVEKTNSTQKKVCFNAFNTIKLTAYETKLTEQGLLLSSAASKDNAGVIKSKIRLAELQAVRKLFTKIIADPHLDCATHLGEAYTIVKDD